MTPAKRGDLLIVERISTASGRSFDSNIVRTYVVGQVTRTHRDGLAAEFTTPAHAGGFETIRLDGSRGTGQTWVLPAADVDASAVLAEARKHTYPGHDATPMPYDTLDEVRAMVKPFRIVLADTWFCSKCGKPGARVDDSRPSIDERYAMGFCPRCSPGPGWSGGMRLRRSAMPIVRGDAWDADLLRRRTEAEQRRKLLADAGNANETGTVRDSATPKRPARVLSDKAMAKAEELLAQYDREATDRRSPASN